MGGSKQKQTQQQQQSFSNTNTYGWMTPPDTADVGAMRDFKFEQDPRLSYSFARAAQRLGDTYNNPMGGYTTPQLRDARLRAGYEDLAQEEGQAVREDSYARQGLDYARKVDVAGMTQPRLAQTSSSGNSSGTSSGTIQQTQSPLNSIIQGGSAISSALIM